MTNTVTITGDLAQSADLPVIELHDKRVITLAMMDKVHQRPAETAGRNFRSNKAKLVEGEDFYSITQPDEIRRLGLAREDGSTPASITLLTESGYLLLVKSFTDDLAWRVQRQLVNGYFRAVGRGNIEKSATETLIPSEAQTLKELVGKRVGVLPEDKRAAAFAEIYARLQNKFRVNKYHLIARTQLADALAYVMTLELKAGLSAAAPAAPAPVAPAERITNNDLQHIKRMIWQVVGHFRFSSSWNQAVWFYLRKVLHLPSPAPLTVDHLPIVARELAQMASITDRVHDLVSDIEAQAAKRIFRKGEAADVVLADLKRLADARMVAISTEQHSLPSWLQRDLQAITQRSPAVPCAYLDNEKPGYFGAPQ